MSPNRCEKYLQYTELFLRMLEGDLSPGTSEAVKDEIRRVLHYVEPPLELPPLPLMDGSD